MGSVAADTGVLKSEPTPAEQSLILSELAAMLASKHFRNSKRYPAFLDFVVRTTLSGDVTNLKERTLGVEIFGRPADYDTGTDPIVRVTAGEVRKRIAQYHDAEGRTAAVRIDLPSGSYLPDFQFADPVTAEFPTSQAPALPPETQEERAAPPPTPESVLPAKERKSHARWLVYAACVVGLLIPGTALLLKKPPTVWDPLFAASHNTLVVVGPAKHPVVETAPPPALSPDDQERSSRRIALADALSVGHICGIVDSHQHHCQVSAVSSVTLSELRETPSVLIGAFNNEWTLRLTEPLRFHFVSGPSDPTISNYRVRYILDRNTHTTTSPWHTDPGDLHKLSYDYAVIARFRSTQTDNYVVIIAGLTSLGTTGAAEFLTSPEHSAELRKAIPHDADANFEAVLETQVIDGHAGHTRIVATEIWR